MSALTLYCDMLVADIVSKVPVTPEELGEIDGFGAAKVKNYGVQLLATIWAFLNSEDLLHLFPHITPLPPVSVLPHCPTWMDPKSEEAQHIRKTAESTTSSTTLKMNPNGNGSVHANPFNASRISQPAHTSPTVTSNFSATLGDNFDYNETQLGYENCDSALTQYTGTIDHQYNPSLSAVMSHSPIKDMAVGVGVPSSSAALDVIKDRNLSSPTAPVASRATGAKGLSYQTHSRGPGPAASIRVPGQAKRPIQLVNATSLAEQGSPTHKIVNPQRKMLKHSYAPTTASSNSHSNDSDSTNFLA